MVKVKSLAEIKANFISGASNAGTRYRQGIAGATWREEALQGQDVYVEKMSNPAVLARRATGIANVSDAQWRTAAADKGGPVIQGRMIASADKQAAGFAPYRAALEAVTLPARTGDPIQNVQNRVVPIVKAMVNTKYPGTY